MRLPRFRPRRRRIGGRLFGVNLSGLRPTSATTRIPLIGSLDWWRAPRRTRRRTP